MEHNEQHVDISDDELALKLFVVLSKAARACMDQNVTDISSYGLNPTEFAVLELLYHKGEQPMQVIGEKILISSGSITYVADKLEKKGFIRRIQSDVDKRMSYASITKSGSDFMESLFPGHQKMIVERFSIFTTSEKKQFISYLKRIGLSLKDTEERIK
jgi:MarR family 2-MHQ and catechol resistance regulon transcriptional repressor